MDNDYFIDQLVFSYYATVMYFIGEDKIDEAVKVANGFLKISDDLTK